MDDGDGRSSGVVVVGEEKGRRETDCTGAKGRDWAGASFEVAVMMFGGRAKEKNTKFWVSQSPNAAWSVRRPFSERN